MSCRSLSQQCSTKKEKLVLQTHSCMKREDSHWIEVTPLQWLSFYNTVCVLPFLSTLQQIQKIGPKIL